MNLLAPLRMGFHRGRSQLPEAPQGEIVQVQAPVIKPAAKQEVAWRCQGLTFLAMTRSEARARIARHFGWSRVPAGTVIERVET